MGTAKLARDKTFQEIFAMKGVPPNTYGYKLLDIRNNSELAQLEAIMGCKLGDKCDASKSRYERVIIGTDADADGYRITSLLLVFFLLHMTDMIRAGKVYKLLPPLYVINGKKINGSEYIDSKRDLNILVQEEISKNITICDNKGKKLKAKSIVDLLQYNRDYYRQLGKLSNKLLVDPLLLEAILRNKDMKRSALAKKLAKDNRDITVKYDKKEDRILIEGIYNREFHYTVVDDRLFNKSKEIIKALEFNKEKLSGLDFIIKDKEVSLYGLLEETSKFKISTTRFKGLTNRSLHTVMYVE